MIKDIIFDLGGVLLDIDLPYCMRSVQALGVDFSAMSAQTSSSLAETQGTKPAVMGEGIVANGALHLYQIGEISTEDFLSGIHRLCRPGTTRQQVIDAWNTCCIGIPSYRLEKNTAAAPAGIPHLHALQHQRRTLAGHRQPLLRRPAHRQPACRPRVPLTGNAPRQAQRRHLSEGAGGLAGKG